MCGFSRIFDKDLQPYLTHIPISYLSTSTSILVVCQEEVASKWKNTRDLKDIQYGTSPFRKQKNWMNTCREEAESQLQTTGLCTFSGPEPIKTSRVVSVAATATQLHSFKFPDIVIWKQFLLAFVWKGVLLRIIPLQCHKKNLFPKKFCFSCDYFAGDILYSVDCNDIGEEDIFTSFVSQNLLWGNHE